MAGSWQPAEDGLRQILQLLKESQSPDNATQRAVQQVKIITIHTRPKMMKYMTKYVHIQRGQGTGYHLCATWLHGGCYALLLILAFLSIFPETRRTQQISRLQQLFNICVDETDVRGRTHSIAQRSDTEEQRQGPFPQISVTRRRFHQERMSLGHRGSVPSDQGHGRYSDHDHRVQRRTGQLARTVAQTMSNARLSSNCLTN